MKKLIEKTIALLKSAWDWVRFDGVLHIAVCMVLTVVLTALFKLVVPVWAAILIACFVTMLVGFAKELWDRCSGKGTAEWHDIICDAVGVAFALVVTLILVF